MDSDQERRTKLIDELTRLDFQASVPSQQEFREFVSSFLDGLGPGAGLIGRLDEYMDLDEPTPTDTPAQKEDGDGIMGAAHSGPIPDNSVTTGNTSDDNNAGAADAARNSDDSQDGGAADDAQHGDDDIKMNTADPDSESVGADKDDTDLGGDYVKLPSGEYAGVWEYFGTNWGAMIVSIYYVRFNHSPY